jgi:Flp pilus assembly protein TadD
MPQAAAPSAVPHESNPADAFKQAKRSLAEGQLDQALSDAKLGLARAPRSVVGLNLLGVIYNQQGKYEEAAMQFQQALAIAPNSVETLVNLANSLAAQNKPELAELTLKKALRVQPGSKTADYNLAAVLLGQNKAKEALTYLLRMPSPDQTTRLMVVRAYLDAGMLATGVAAAEKLSKDCAKDTRVHFSLGVLLASHRQYRGVCLRI